MSLELRRIFSASLSILLLLAFAGNIAPKVKATTTLHRLNPLIGGANYYVYSISTDGTNLYVPELYSTDRTRILKLNSSNIGTENPSWTVIGQTPSSYRVNERHIITKDGKWIYGVGVRVPPPTVGVVRINLTNPSSGYANVTKTDGSVLKSHPYLPSLTEDNQNRIYVAEYYGTYNACIWRGNSGATQFALFKNITQEWINQGKVAGSATYHLHSIVFNEDYTRLYFAWDKVGGHVNMNTNATTFFTLPVGWNERCSFATEKSIYDTNEVLLFSDDTKVNIWRYDLNGQKTTQYNIVNYTTKTPLWDFPATIWGDKLINAYYAPTLENGFYGGIGYLNLIDGQWTNIHTVGNSTDYFAVRIGDYIYFSVSGSTSDINRGIFYFNLNELPLYDYIHEGIEFRYLQGGKLTSSSYSNNKLTFTVSASSGTTSTTKVYCNDKGEPKRVLIGNIDQPVNYNSSTKILTITATHTSNPTEIVVDWRIPGDANGDGKVDVSDLTEFSEAYGSILASPNWNPNCDFNRDNMISVLDLYSVGKNYGKTKP